MKYLLNIYILIFLSSIAWAQSINDLDWQFVVGSKNETLLNNYVPDFQSSKYIHLPHSVNLPNTALWYQAFLKLSFDGFIKIYADDGAQLWLNNNRVYAVRGNIYPIDIDNNLVKIKIRVLNNAVNGGLKKIELLSKEEFEIIDISYRKAMEDLSNKTIKPFTPISNLKEFSFSFWGDPQGKWQTFSKIVSHINHFDDPLTLGLGDFVSDGYDPNQWVAFMNIISNLNANINLLTIPGNHDYDGYYDDLIAINYLTYINRYKDKKTYGYEYVSGCSFLMLDPNKNFPLDIDKEQQMFIDSIFLSKKWNNSDWRFIIVHQVPYGQGWLGYKGDLFLREWLDQHAEKNKIDVILGGHIHDYERLTKKINNHSFTCIVSGGAGGSLEPPVSNPSPIMDKIIKKHHFGRMEVGKKNLLIKIYDLNNEIIDSITIKKQKQ